MDGGVLTYGRLSEISGDVSEDNSTISGGTRGKNKRDRRCCYNGNGIARIKEKEQCSSLIA